MGLMLTVCAKAAEAYNNDLIIISLYLGRLYVNSRL
jgi:hypothetical protein